MTHRFRCSSLLENFVKALSFAPFTTGCGTFQSTEILACDKHSLCPYISRASFHTIQHTWPFVLTEFCYKPSISMFPSSTLALPNLCIVKLHPGKHLTVSCGLEIVSDKYVSYSFYDKKLSFIPSCPPISIQATTSYV